MIATTLFDESKHSLITKILVGGLIYSSFIWFIAVVTSSFDYVYECKRKIKLIISMSILVVSTIQLYLFYTILNSVKQSQ